MLRNYATQAGKRYDDRLKEGSEKFAGIDVEFGETRVRGIYRKPFSSQWEIHFNYKCENSVSTWIINYEASTNASDEQHIDEILRLLWERQSFR